MEDQRQVTCRHFFISEAPDDVPALKLLSAIAVKSIALVPGGGLGIVGPGTVSRLNCSQRHTREAYTFLRVSRTISAASIGFVACWGRDGTISARRSVTCTR